MANINISSLRRGPSVQLGLEQSIDAIYGGPLRFAGTVLVVETPAPARRVRLHARDTGTLARETWSDATGAFEFRNIASREYYLVAFDQNGGYDPTCSPVVTPA